MLGSQTASSTFATPPWVVATLQFLGRLPFEAQVFVGIVSLLLVVVLLNILWESIRGPVTERYVEGFKVVSHKELAKITAYKDKAKRPFQIMFGQVPWPKALENMHALIVGTTGVGKSTLLRQILSRIRAKGGRAIVVDLNGEFAAKFLIDGDKIFNPFDKKSVRWNPLAEIHSDEDVDTVVRAMIPSGSTQEDENWRGYARQFLQTLMRRLREQGELNMDRLRHYAIAAGNKEVDAFFQRGSKSSRLQENSMVSNTKTLVKDCVESWEHASQETNFSIKEWVREGKGFIFITPRDSQREALKPLINAFMNLAVAQALSPPDRTPLPPVSLVVDELSSFEFDDLQGVLEKGRKFGLVAYAGIQNIAQLRQKYGADGADVLMSCFRTKIIFNPGDAATGEKMAAEIGSVTVETLEVSSSNGKKGGSVTKSWRLQKPKPAVSGDQLRKLPNLQAYVKFDGDYPIAKITLQP